MKSLLLLCVLQLYLETFYAIESIGHPIRHQRSERKNKNFQSTSPTSIFSIKLSEKYEPKSADNVAASNEPTTKINNISDNEKDPSENLEWSRILMEGRNKPENNQSFNYKGGVTSTVMDPVSPHFRSFNFIKQKHSAKSVSDFMKSIILQKQDIESSNLTTVNVTYRNSDAKIKLPFHAGKLNTFQKKSNYSFDYEDYQSDSPLPKSGQLTEFTRHNITVESPNHDDSKEMLDSFRKQISKIANENEDAQWNVNIPEVSSPQHNLNNTSTRILAPVGGDALLPCRVGHLGDRQVSWIRIRDWFVLTSGDSMYAHNDRFLVLHEAGSQDWTLHIKRAVKGDSGMYECQVSTGTGIISFIVKLEVVVPTAYIPGNGRSHVYRGSPFTIFCYIMKSPSAMQLVMWHHNGEPLNYQRERTDFKITTRVQRKDSKAVDSQEDYEDEEMENEFNNNIDKNIIISRLKVPYAKEEHSGNYSCSGQNVQPTSTLIFVTEGDKTAAVQRIDSGTSLTPICHRYILVMIYIVLNMK